jgi:hypothetical protein
MTDNPYVGPRPFGTDQRALFFGRDREVRELADLLVAERVVLVHAPSGAGKTSLIQAGLIPAVAADFDVLPVVRVGHPAPPGVNRYRHSALASLGAPASPTVSLADYLAGLHKGGRPQLVIFDQFEEVLTLDPYDLDAKEAFFADLVAVLRRDRGAPGAARRWALFAMRDEFVAALSPYLKRLPTGLGEMYRLDLLGKVAALDAVRRPAVERGVQFDRAAADALVDNLRRVRGKVAGEPGPPGPYVEPVQLQVVCYRMWEKLREKTAGAPADDEAGRAAQGRLWQEKLAAGQVTIGPGDVPALANVDEALAEYYAERVKRAADRGRTSERAVRAWVANYLITPAGFRAAVQIGSGLGGDPDPDVLKELDDAHLIRRDERLGQVWVQLSHDRLLDPIRANNRRWMEEKLAPFQLQAIQWESQNEPRRLLLTGTALRDAETWASRDPGRLDPTDRRFLDASGGWIATTRWERARRHFYRNRRGWLAAAVAVMVLGFSLDAWVQRRRLADRNAQLTKAEADLLANQGVLEDQKKQAEKLAREKQDLLDRLDAAAKNANLKTVAQIQKSSEEKVGTTGPPDESAAVVEAKRWPNGTRLRLRFLDGPPDVQRRVRELAQQWTLYANIRFDFLDAGADPADVRITFKEPGAWSYMGTDAKEVRAPGPTMSLQAITQESSESIVSTLVLRQFGHLLGMVDAAKNPAAPIKWNREAVYRYYAARGMSRDMVDQQLLQKYSGPVTDWGPFDPKSVMLFPIPKELTLDGFSSDWNPVLSDGDKKAAARFYPFPGQPTELAVGGTSAPVAAEALRVDRYRFRVAADGTYAATVQGPPGAEVVLFGPDSDVNVAATNHASKPPHNGASAALGPGVYLLKVRYLRVEPGSKYTVAVAQEK